MSSGIRVFFLLVFVFATTASPIQRPTIFLDVDNTLYRNSNVEHQIVDNIHQYCRSKFGMTPDQADELHHKYGSTIQGIRKIIWKDLCSEEQHLLLEDFYTSVYKDVSVASLLATDSGKGSDSTGYSHTCGDRLRRLWKVCGPRLAIASNSPLPHVHRVLRALGLPPCARIYTPCQENNYATKYCPNEYFHVPIGERLNGVLIDDSLTNLDACQPIMDVIHVNETQTLEHAIGIAMGWQDPSFRFSAVEYLKAKNRVDSASLNREVWEQVRAVLAEKDILKVVDVGAGILFMLRLIVGGLPDDMPPLIHSGLRELEYIAFEPNVELRPECEQVLLELGFHPAKSTAADDRHTFEADCSGTRVVVRLNFFDFRNARIAEPDLLIGACFADLFEPRDLVASLVRSFLSGDTDSNCLVYLPLTFNGCTQLLPPAPQSTSRRIPSDAYVFEQYSRDLESHLGHNLDPQRITAAITDYGGKLIDQGRSTWNIDKKQNRVFWNTMAFFFASVSALSLEETGWDMRYWFQRTRTEAHIIRAFNVDLLFRLPTLGASLKVKQKENRGSKIHREIVFEDSCQVSTREITERSLRPTEVRIQTVASLVSSGTELKLFQGDFEDAQLDTSIAGMASERMAYPFSFGYSLVGKVTECGTDVHDSKAILGHLVFVFAPHASECVADRSSIHLVPDGVSPFDAIFMPSVETAISIVQDANPRFGDEIVIFGQGLIGLLVSQVLSLYGHSPSHPGFVTCVDLVTDRLAAASRLGIKQAIPPDLLGEVNFFDLAIELSGNGQGLQSAIDCTRKGGKIVVGSWYGKSPFSLKLGIDFHRSFKTIQATQVSDIPSSLSMTWSKHRRFGLTWDTLKQLKPSRFISKYATLEDCQQAYESLQNSVETVIAFTYA